MSVSRMVAKTLSFDLLYGQRGRGLKKLAMPMPTWEPSAVERLAALADPDMARKVEEFDRPMLKAARLTEQWEKMWGMDKTHLTNALARTFSTGSKAAETSVPSAGKRNAIPATPRDASGD